MAHEDTISFPRDSDTSAGLDKPMVSPAALGSHPRGLSRLQRAILILAITNSERDAKRGPAVTRYEVFESYYGWKPVKPQMQRSSSVFSPDLIGRSRYRAAQVSLSKAVKRLVHRGLLEYTPQRMSLTNAGLVAAAAALRANGADFEGTFTQTGV